MRYGAGSHRQPVVYDFTPWFIATSTGAAGIHDIMPKIGYYLLPYWKYYDEVQEIVLMADGRPTAPC